MEQMQTTKRINTWLVIETLGIFGGLSVLSVFVHLRWHNLLLNLPILFCQGLWFYRFYIAGHEASHRKLFPESKTANDFWGCVILLPLMVPVNVYRKIHMFHHGFNRKDEHTSSLDTFVSDRKPGVLKKVWYFTLWYLSVFCGGFFLHSMVSVLLFLFIPPNLSPKISPAFKGWTWGDQFIAILIFLAGVALHLGVFLMLGTEIYLYALGLPLLFFGWILSLIVYIFHFDTTQGDHVRYNVRSTRRVPVLSWVLMNFNEHATHHQYPNIPWHELPVKRSPLPEDFERQNQNTWSFFRAVLNQFKGPRIIYPK